MINEFDPPDHGWKWRDCEIRWIKAKIAEAVAAEREACADGVARRAAAVRAANTRRGKVTDAAQWLADTLDEEAEAIRERSNTN